MPKKDPERPLYVRLPASAGDKLDHAAETLGIAKKDLVARLVDRYLPTAGSDPRRISIDLGDAGPAVGSYSFQAYDPPEVMTADQAARLLQVEEKLVIELAEAGKLPGRKLGAVWRFSRAALVAWLSAAEPR